MDKVRMPRYMKEEEGMVYNKKAFMEEIKNNLNTDHTYEAKPIGETGPIGMKFSPGKCDNFFEDEHLMLDHIGECDNFFKDEHEMLEYIHEKLCLIISELFGLKNRKYGNRNIKSSRVCIRNEIGRKYARYDSMFEEHNNAIVFKDPEKKKKDILPTLIDMANYCIIGIVKEINDSFCDGSDLKIKKTQNFLSGIRKEILESKENINLDEIAKKVLEEE